MLTVISKVQLGLRVTKTETWNSGLRPTGENEVFFHVRYILHKYNFMLQS